MKRPTILALVLTALACSHVSTRPGYYECADRCAREHPTSIGFSRGDCISRCQGYGPKVNRTPGETAAQAAGAP